MHGTDARVASAQRSRTTLMTWVRHEGRWFAEALEGAQHAAHDVAIVFAGDPDISRPIAALRTGRKTAHASVVIQKCRHW